MGFRGPETVNPHTAHDVFARRSERIMVDRLRRNICVIRALHADVGMLA